MDSARTVPLAQWFRDSSTIALRGVAVATSACLRRGLPADVRPASSGDNTSRQDVIRCSLAKQSWRPRQWWRSVAWQSRRAAVRALAPAAGSPAVPAVARSTAARWAAVPPVCPPPRAPALPRRQAWAAPAASLPAAAPRVRRPAGRALDFPVAVSVPVPAAEPALARVLDLARARERETQQAEAAHRRPCLRRHHHRSVGPQRNRLAPASPAAAQPNPRRCLVAADRARWHTTLGRSIRQHEHAVRESAMLWRNPERFCRALRGLPLQDGRQNANPAYSAQTDLPSWATIRR